MGIPSLIVEVGGNLLIIFFFQFDNVTRQELLLSLKYQNILQVFLLVAVDNDDNTTCSKQISTL